MGKQQTISFFNSAARPLIFRVLVGWYIGRLVSSCNFLSFVNIILFILDTFYFPVVWDNSHVCNTFT